MPVIRVGGVFRIYYRDQAERQWIESRLHEATPAFRTQLRQIIGKRIVYIAILDLSGDFVNLFDRRDGTVRQTNGGQYGEGNAVPMLWIRLKGKKIGCAGGWDEFFDKMTSLLTDIGFCGIHYLAIEHDMPEEMVEQAIHFLMLRWRISGEWYNLNTSDKIRLILRRVSTANSEYNTDNNLPDAPCRFVFGSKGSPDEANATYTVPRDAPHGTTTQGFLYIAKDVYHQSEIDLLDSIINNQNIPANLRRIARYMRDGVKIGSTDPDDSRTFTLAALLERIRKHFWCKCTMDSVQYAASPSLDCRADERRVHGDHYDFDSTVVTGGTEFQLANRPVHSSHIVREHFMLTNQQIDEGRDSTWADFFAAQPPGQPFIGGGVVMNGVRERVNAPPLGVPQDYLNQWLSLGLVTNDDLTDNMGLFVLEA